MALQTESALQTQSHFEPNFGDEMKSRMQESVNTPELKEEVIDTVRFE